MSGAKREVPIGGLLLASKENLDNYDADAPPEYQAATLTTDLDAANLATSLTASDPRMHKVVIDLDLPTVLVPSSTPGHFHLYIDKEMTWEQYRGLLAALVSAGLVEPGYVGASEARGYTAVRLPWIKKKAQS